MTDATHASFFSGAGGLDLGLERAGWRTVSFSEIDPYASAVLAQRWPGVPNLGDIVELRSDDLAGPGATPDVVSTAEDRHGIGLCRLGAGGAATLWTGGFPCQDLSVAGKRRGLAGARSGLAVAFLDLVGRHRPRAVLLENVPGLLSSHGGRDFGTLLATLGELRYWWAYRILDARHFGVPQRRRRVFILALDADRYPDPDGPGAVLAVGTRCRRHPPTGIETGAGAAERTGFGTDTARTVQSAFGHHGWTLGAQDVDGGYLQLSHAVSTRTARLKGTDQQDYLVGAPPDPGRVRAADGLAGRLDGGDGVVGTLRVGAQRNADGGPGDTVPIVAFTKRTRGGINATHGHESWGDGELAGTLDGIGQPPRTATAVVGGDVNNDPLLPLGLDSHRYRCCGNGVVADVAEWIGARLLAALGAA